MAGSGRATGLIGRERELRQLLEVLARGRSALVVVEGELGMGKSSLLQALAERADGWTTAFRDDTGGLSIGPGTSEEALRLRVLELLGLSARAGDLDASEQRRKKSSLPSATGRGSYLLSLVDRTSRLSRTLILVDGFEPPAGLLRRFIELFLPGIRASGSPIVVVVAGQSPAMTRLRAHADLRLQLGPLDPQAVRHHLESEFGGRLAPPFAPAELDRYVEVGRSRPRLLRSLIDVLELACPQP